MHRSLWSAVDAAGIQWLLAASPVNVMFAHWLLALTYIKCELQAQKMQTAKSAAIRSRLLLEQLGQKHVKSKQPLRHDTGQQGQQVQYARLNPAVTTQATAASSSRPHAHLSVSKQLRASFDKPTESLRQDNKLPVRSRAEGGRKRRK